MFSVVAGDECQVMKSLSAKGSLAIQWLLPDFYIMISATPMPNGSSDWQGYMPFIESYSSEDWYSRESLEEMGVNERDDSFLLS